jgi:hypothetical protein
MTRALEVNLSYQPMPKQAEAHGLAGKYRSFVGGWGNGKTSWGCAETFILLQEFPGTTCIISRKTRPELRATTWDMFVNGDKDQPNGWHGVPRPLIKVHRSSDLYLEMLTSDPDRPSKVYGLPLDDPAKIENYNLGLFWIDQAEEVEEDIFLKFHGRLRQKSAPRMGLLTWNPSGHSWLWKRFINPERKPIWHKNYTAVEATTYDNPNLPEDYFEQFEGLPQAWLERFVLGSHEVFVGQIFTDYDSDVHVCPPFAIPQHWPRAFCMDPGIRHEAAASWVAFDYEGNAYYYREHLQANKDVAWWAEFIHRTEAAYDWGGPNERVQYRFIGPEATQRAQTDGRTVFDLFWQHGVFCELADRDPSARIAKITEFLRPLAGHRNPFTGQTPGPRLYVFDTCEKFKEYLPQYRWRPQRVNFAEEDLPERPRKKDDHNIDNLGHILLAFPGVPHEEDPGPPLSPDSRMVKELMDESYEQATSTTARHPVLGGSV